jgi:hypothetical protein
MSTETFTPDALVAGSFDIVTDSATLVSGQNLLRGAVLGKITTGGKLNLSLSAASDGSQTPLAVLAESCDASGGDKTCNIYLTGEFNQDALTIGTAHTAASIKDGLRAKGIFLKSPVSA